ncbi:hypothetical protein [Roseibium sp. RKSG952]|uniref:hypothetical protein n=1 Tax=Roseibium sp. RKSG952 TaxID=2529384 RepID=UPI0012BD1B79|nr:hypothetical protein [Roseibium sp. RKSG952]
MSDAGSSFKMGLFCETPADGRLASDTARRVAWQGNNAVSPFLRRFALGKVSDVCLAR